MTTLTSKPTSLLAETNAMLRGPVTILDDYGHVDKDRVHVNKKKKEQIVWHNSTKSEVLIVFDESPFDESVFKVAAGKTVPSGVSTKDPGEKYYKYTVIAALGNNDPGVIIDP